MASEFQPRELVMNARIAVLVQACIGILLLSIMMGLQLKALSERWANFRVCTKRSDRTFVWFMSTTGTSIMFYVLAILMYTIDWTGNDAECRLFGQPFIPLLFFTAKQFLYMFLYERSCVVHDSLKMNKGGFIIFRRSLAAFIILGVPAAFYWTFFLVFDAHVMVPEGFCVLFFTNFAPIVAFAAVDWVLSMFLLALFAYPLYKHLKSISSQGNLVDDKLYKLLRKNMILSICITNGTFCNLLAMVVLLAYHGQDSARDGEHLQIYAMFFAAWDGMVSIGFCSAMTTLWVPKALAARIKMSSEEDISKNNTSKDASKDTSKKEDTTQMSSVVFTPTSTAVVAPAFDDVA